MLDSLKNKIKAEYEKQSKMTPQDYDSPEGKAKARRGGLVFLILGLVGLGANWYVLTYHGSIHSLLIAATLTFLGLGIWVLITGKMPVKKR